MPEGNDLKPDLFKDVKFCIIEDGENLDKVKTILLNGGGKHFNYLSDIVTHVIADNPDSPDVSEAQELFEKPVVTSRWVLLSAKCNSLLPINGFSPVKNQLFSGTVICPSQISATDFKFLWAMATFYGGTFQIELNKSCTHLVAGKAEGAKYEQALKNPNIMKIVTPDWVLDSVKNKRLCDEDLYHPRLLILPEPEIPKILTPSPLSSSVTSALISLNRMNLVESLGQNPIQLPPQLAPRTVKIPSLENRLLQDVAKTLSSTITIKTEPNTQQFTTPEQNVVSSKTPPFPVLPHQQMQQSPRQLPSPVSQHSFIQSQQHQILQGDQKLSQALQHLQAQQQPQLQRPQQNQQSPQVLQQKLPWQQQRMTYVQQQQIQQQLLQMQRYRLMQQQLRNRQPLPSAQLSHLQQQSQPHLQQQQSSQSHLQQQQQPKQPQLHVQQLHLQPQPLHVQQQHSLVQAPSQQPLISQQHMQQQSRPQTTVQPQLHLQAQPQIHQQPPQPLSSQLQQQALQKQQIQQQHLQQLQQQQQLMKQQHLQHLQQQQQQQQAHLQQQQTLPQPTHLQQTHIQQSSPHHLQQQTLMQPSPQRSPLQQSPLQQSPIQQSPLQQSPIQQSPQQNQLQQPALQQSQLQQTTIQPSQQSHLQQQTQPLLTQQPHIQQQQQSPLQQPHLPQPQQQQSPLQQSLHIQQPPPQPLPKPPQQPLMSQQQSHVQQQPSPHLHQQLQQQPSPQPPPSPHLQQQPRFTHQLHQNLRPVQKAFQQVTFPPTQQPMHGQPPVQGLHQQQQQQQQQQLLQQNQLRQQQLQQHLALQQMRQRQLQQQQLQSSQPPTQAQSTQQVLAGQPPVMMKPPPQYPYDRQQLTGQPRLQYPPHPRQIPPQMQQQPTPQQQQQRLPWQQFPQQQQQIIQRPPGTPQPQSPQWQQLQQASPKDELSPSPQSLQQQQILWQQRQQQQQQLQQDQQRDNPTPAPQIVWQQQQQQPSQPRESSQPLQPPQLLQWQQLKQIELRRQQLLQQQQQFQSQRQTTLVQFSPQSDLPQNVARVTVPPQHQQPLAVPAQYQPQNPPTILSQQTPPNISQVVQPPTQVTPKTKTALANLLNTRLQGTGRMMEVDCNQPVVRNNQVIAVPPEGETPTHFQHPVQTSSVPRRSSAENMTLIHSVVPHSVIQERNSITPVPQVHFYGHDPRIHVPSDLSLLGCIFCIQDYDTNVDTERLAMWKKVINQHGGEVESSFNSRCTHVLCESQRNSVVQQAMREGKRCITAFWLNDVLQQKKMKPPWLALHLPSPFLDDKPCKNQIITVTNFEGDERMWLKRMVHSVGAKYTGYMTQHNTLIICKRKDGTKAVKAREWKIPAVNVQWLHDVMFGHYDALRLPMAHKYQQYDLEDHFKIDYALVPHLMAAWKSPIKINEEMWKKFLPLNNSNMNKDDKKRKREETEEGNEAKQPRSESPPLEENIPLTTQNPPTEEAKPHVMFTGLKHFKAYSKIVYQLGGCLSRSSKECTHLVATHFVRTVKFLCAIHTVKYVVIPEWLTESEKQNRFVDEQQYILHDPEGEKQFGFSLRETLSRADKTPIFKGFVFFVTPGVYPPPAVLKDVVENGEGTVVFKKRPTYRQITAMTQAGTQFVVITCENDLHLCKDFLQKKINVQNAEFLLTGSLRQQLDFQSFAFT